MDRALRAGVDFTTQLWSLVDGAMLANLEGHAGPLVAAAVRALDGSIVTASQDGSVKLWDGRNGAPIRSVAQLEFSPGALVLSPRGDNAVITCADRCRRNFEQVVLNLVTGKPQAAYGLHDGFVFAATITPDGTVATAGGTRHEIHLWRVDDVKQIGRAHV